MKTTKEMRKNTVLVSQDFHPRGGALLTEIRKNETHYFILYGGKWKDACALTHAEYNEYIKSDSPETYLRMFSVICR
jgi:hypothetical protein